MSETAGGCVYDGRPLDGVQVRLDDGRICLAGPVLMAGYRLRADISVEVLRRRLARDVRSRRGRRVRTAAGHRTCRRRRDHRRREGGVVAGRRCAFDPSRPCRRRRHRSRGSGVGSADRRCGGPSKGGGRGLDCGPSSVVLGPPCRRRLGRVVSSWSTTSRALRPASRIGSRSLALRRRTQAETAYSQSAEPGSVW